MTCIAPWTMQQSNGTRTSSADLFQAWAYKGDSQDKGLEVLECIRFRVGCRVRQVAVPVV